MLLISRTIPARFAGRAFRAAVRRLSTASSSIWTCSVAGVETATVNVTTWGEDERSVAWELERIVKEVQRG